MRKYGKFTILGVALTIAALTTSCGTKKAVTNDGADIRKLRQPPPTTPTARTPRAKGRWKRQRWTS